MYVNTSRKSTIYLTYNLTNDIGFHGDLCELQIDNLCDLNQCQHNGTCTGSRDNYTCACAKGFEGHHCEIDVNDCAAGPCGEYGICVDKTGGHQCYCTPGECYQFLKYIKNFT